MGYHYLVTDNEIICFIPEEEIAFHAGSEQGNLQSIGIERLVNKNIDFEKAISIQAKLAATLMIKWNIPISNVVPHKHWVDVDCPSRLLAGLNGGWNGFINKVQYYFEKRDVFSEIVKRGKNEKYKR